MYYDNLAIPLFIKQITCLISSNGYKFGVFFKKDFDQYKTGFNGTLGRDNR